MAVLAADRVVVRMSAAAASRSVAVRAQQRKKCAGSEWFRLLLSPCLALRTPNPLHGMVFCHCDHGAGERAVGLSQLIQDREVIGVGDRYQVSWDMLLRSVGM